MTFKRFFLSVLAVYITFQVINFIVHSLILGSVYMELQNVWRMDMMDMMWAMYIIDLLVCIMFVYIFTKGYEGKGIMEGLRYGLTIGLLMSIPASFYQYILYPIPFNLIIQWFIYGMIQYTICGMVAAAVYKK